MNASRQLHRQAMDLAEEALVLRLKGDSQKAVELFAKAFEFESKAAGQVQGETTELETSRTVLLRSSASLALQAGLYREAEVHIAKGLSGNPPFPIAEELRDLLEQVNFERHLRLRGVSLGEQEVQLSVAGNAVGFGLALSEEVISRVKTFQTMVYRTAERLTQRAFRDTGAPDTSVRRQYELFLSAPRAASFAVTMRIGKPTPQIGLPGVDQSREILDEILTNIGLINEAKESQAKPNFPDEAYFRNFVALAKNLAPDGEEVSLVGLTAIREGIEKRIELSRVASRITAEEGAKPIKPTRNKIITISGTLLWADETAIEKSRIKLIDKTGKEHKISVPKGMMADIVKPLWGEDVEVKGIEKKIGRGVFIELSDINRVK